MQTQIIYTGRKSFMAYIASAIATSFWVFLTGGSAVWAAAGGRPILAFVLGALCMLIAAFGLYNLFYLRTIRWIITAEELRIEEGILPWRKSSFGHAYETIFEAYFQFGLLAKVFGYGTCAIRRTEGNTTGASETRMHDAEKITSLINQQVKAYRKAMRPAVATASARADTWARTQVQELADLARLKAAGAVTTEEFEALKHRILETQPAALEGGAS